MSIKLKAPKKVNVVPSKTRKVDPLLVARALGAELVSSKEFWATYWFLLRKIPK